MSASLNEPVTGFEPANAGMKILCVKPLHHTGILSFKEVKIQRTK